MKRDNPRVKYWILLDKALNPVSGTLRKSIRKPKTGHWVDITDCARLCCNYQGEVLYLIAVPSTVSVEEELTSQLTVIAVYSDGSTSNVTNQALYESDDDTTATVSETGLVTGVTDGSATITVSFGDQEIEVEVTVTDPALTGLRFDPEPSPDWEVDESDTLQVTVYAQYSNNTEVDVTTTATYGVDDTNIATMVNGLISGVAAGSTTVDVDFGTESETITITVT